MESVNRDCFEKLLVFVNSHVNGKYAFSYDTGKSCDAVFDSVYDSDNGLDADDEEYEEYKCISFKDISSGMLFEINYRQIPSMAICDGEVIYKTERR